MIFCGMMGTFDLPSDQLSGLPEPHHRSNLSSWKGYFRDALINRIHAR
jgi:hypothetical protein